MLKASAVAVMILAAPLSTVSAEELPDLPPGPLLLTSMTPDQLNADYWINRLQNPDRPLKTPEEVIQFNREIRMMIRERKDLFAMEPVRSGGPIRDQMELEYNTIKGRILFDVYDTRIPQSFFESEVRPVMRWELVPSKIRLRWGAAVQATSVRALPTDVKMLEEVGDIEFDQLQFTQIKLWTPVAVYHESADGRWYYIQAPYARGWVRSRDIALFSSRERLKTFVKGKAFIVVTAESTPVYQDPGLILEIQRPSMGTRLPLAGETDKAYIVWMPNREIDGYVAFTKAYVDFKSDVTEGYLPFTQRNVIRQAFKMLGARYGWGGMYNGRDCSGFTFDVFTSLGIEVPRTSKGQSLIGTQLSHFDYRHHAAAKQKWLNEATPAITLLTMPMHQMIYLGEIDGRYYVIHSTWAERISMTSDEKNRINQVVVSDLSLNGNSYLGSLFDRIISMNEID